MFVCSSARICVLAAVSSISGIRASVVRYRASPVRLHQCVSSLLRRQIQSADSNRSYCEQSGFVRAFHLLGLFVLSSASLLRTVLCSQALSYLSSPSKHHEAASDLITKHEDPSRLDTGQRLAVRRKIFRWYVGYFSWP